MVVNRLLFGDAPTGSTRLVVWWYTNTIGHSRFERLVCTVKSTAKAVLFL